jgi:hypothetical protein
MYALTATIAGRRHHPAPIGPTSTITLRPESDHPIDRAAVAILADGAKVGYLEAGLARLVAPLLRRGRPVLAAPMDERHISVYVPGPRDRIGGSIRAVTSSDGKRSYFVDRVRALCTCPAGRYGSCRHRRLVQSQRRRGRSATVSTDLVR